MISAEELAVKQPVVYHTLKNALERQNVSQSYLFAGDKGMIMMETANLLAASIIEGQNDFANTNSEISERIENGTFTDLIVLDGSDKSIKKEQIILLQDQFSKTALEIYGKKIYIINAVENATTEALNSLLKFLEEPNSDIYAILITYQQDRLLDTIISRCQNLRFRAASARDTIDMCINNGVNAEDAEIVGHIVNDAKQIQEITLRKNYGNIKSEALEFIKAFQQDPDLGGIELQNFYQESNKSKKYEKSDYKLLIDIVTVFYREVVTKTFDGDELWNKLRDSERTEVVPRYLQALLEIGDEFQKAPNVGLAFDRLIYKMKKNKEARK